MPIFAIDKTTLSLIHADADSYKKVAALSEFQAIKAAFEKLLKGDSNNPHFLDNVNVSDYINAQIRLKLINFFQSEAIKKYNQEVYEATFRLLTLLAYYWPLNRINEDLQPEGQLGPVPHEQHYLCPITHEAVGGFQKDNTAILISGHLVTKSALLEYWQRDARNRHPELGSPVTEREKEAILVLEVPPLPAKSLQDFQSEYNRERIKGPFAVACVVGATIGVIAFAVVFPALGIPALGAWFLGVGIMLGTAAAGGHFGRKWLLKKAEKIYNATIGRSESEYQQKKKTNNEIPLVLKSIDAERAKLQDVVRPAIVPAPAPAIARPIEPQPNWLYRLFFAPRVEHRVERPAWFDERFPQQPVVENIPAPQEVPAPVVNVAEERQLLIDAQVEGEVRIDVQPVVEEGVPASPAVRINAQKALLRSQRSLMLDRAHQRRLEEEQQRNEFQPAAAPRR